MMKIAKEEFDLDIQRSVICREVHFRFEIVFVQLLQRQTFGLRLHH